MLLGLCACPCCRVVCCVPCRSSKLWAFYADLEESLGTLESACAVYDKMLELKVATPQIILNYALMLQVSLVGSCSDGRTCGGQLWLHWCGPQG